MTEVLIKFEQTPYYFICIAPGYQERKEGVGETAPFKYVAMIELEFCKYEINQNTGKANAVNQGHIVFEAIEAVVRDDKAEAKQDAINWLDTTAKEFIREIKDKYAKVP